VIDPVLVYGTFLADWRTIRRSGLPLTAKAAPTLRDQHNPPTFLWAGQNGQPPSGTNVFLAKLDVSGSSLVYADYIGGNSEDYPTAMTMDSENHVFITGYTYSGDFPT